MGETTGPAERIALVGFGVWGERILADLHGLGRRVEVVEPRADRRRLASDAGASRTVASVAELGTVAGIVVATPASTHAEVVEAVLPRDVPVLCEKPLTDDVASARRIVALGGNRLFVGHVWSYHPGVEALAAIARGGELGPVRGLRSTRGNWTSPRRDVDSAWNLAPHDVALGQVILGGIPEPRFALAERNADGRCVGLVGILGDAPWLVFEVSNRLARKSREIRLHCRDGVAVLPDGDAGAVEIARDGSGSEPTVEHRAISREPALRRELAAFCAHLSGGPAPLTTGADGLAVVEAIVRLRALAGLD